MINPMFPSEITVQPIPRQRLPSCVRLFRLIEFNGVSLTIKLHTIAQIVTIFINLLALIGLWTRGLGYAIFGTIFIPLWLVVQVAAIRVLAELIISVLLLPPLLAKSQPPPLDNLDVYGQPHITTSNV